LFFPYSPYAEYPELEGDEARRGIWLHDVPLAATHHLRNTIVSANAVSFETFDKYEIPIVASLLKLYLLELPDSIVSSHVYEIVKTIYTTTAPTTSEITRISVIQSTLGQLRLANIATLDAITTHFTRLIELTSADEQYNAALATAMAPCVLRPKQESSLTMTEKFNVRLLRDLFAHKDAIFGELKRASSISQRQQEGARQRAISTDESNRRQAMEERQRAIAANAERTRAHSPARFPAGLGSIHRRERSTSAETRFPIATNIASGPLSPVDQRRGRGGSLEVPDSPARITGQPVAVPDTTSTSPPTTNGVHQALSYAPAPPSKDAPSATNGTRQRSDTTNSVITTPMTSASLLGPIDFGPPVADYQHDSPSTEDAPVSNDTASSAAPSSADVEKRNSLSRARNQFQRKPTGGLQRQSLIGKRDSVSSTHGRDSRRGSQTGVTSQTASEAAEATTVAGEDASNAGHEAEKRGVELVDRPMDD